MLRISTVATGLAFSALFAVSSAQAASFDVYALANSSSGGIGLDTISLTAGQSFSVSADAGDLWNAGALPRWSNADGLTGNLFATGTDDSGEPATTLIGQAFGSWAQGNLTAPYGALVGQIDSGDYFLVGTSFTGTASATGTLKLYYWDSNNGDNTEFITANVSVVPEPEGFAMMLAGLGVMGFLARRRRA
ncbi:MAG: PEP-CTERM sorting domain-containing protein [Burkholderiales bacterium]